MIKISVLFLSPLVLLAAQSVYSVEGRMVDDIRGQSIQNVRVVLSGDSLRIPALAISASDGTFSFTVPAGRYKLSMDKAGFFPFPPEDVEVRDKVTLGDITVTAKRTISGTVTWRDGEPVTDVIVSARPVRGVKAAAVSPEGAGGGRLDDRGGFLFSGLRPGRYVIAPLGAEVAGIVPRAIALQPIDPNTSIDLINAADATVSVIFDERQGVDIEGTVAVSPNLPVGSNVTLDLRIVPDLYIARIGARPGQPFKIPNIPPGNYQILTTRQTPAEVQFGVQDLQVGSTPISGLSLSVPDSLPLTGKAEIEDPAGPAPAPNVGIRAYSDKYSLNGPGGRTDAKGDFRVIATMPGDQYRLTIETLPPGTYVSSVTQGQRTSSKDPYLVTANAEPIQILLKKDGGKISGQILQKSGLPHPGFIVLAPTDRQLTHSFRTIATDRQRTFQIAGIPPGTYQLFAFDQESDYQGDETLDEFAARAKPVTIERNASLTFQLEPLR
jgi:hypothetical protein